MDAVFVRLGWMPLYQLLIFRALVWFVKGKKGLAGSALQDLISDLSNTNGSWNRTRFFAPAMNTLSLLNPVSAEGSTIDYFGLPVPQLKKVLRASIFSDLNSHWSKSKWAPITHRIHPKWEPRILPTAMHSRFSHVLYHCAALNRAPLRRWLYKIGRAKSELCRYGCEAVEDIDHVINDCPHVCDERCYIRKLCDNKTQCFSVINILTDPCLQFATEKLLLAFLCNS